MNPEKEPSYSSKSVDEFLSKFKLIPAEYNNQEGDGFFNVQPEEKASMSVPREEMTLALQATKSEVGTIADKLRADLAEHRGDMKAAVETLRADMHKATSENIRWAVGTGIALAALTITILSFVINNAAKVPQVQQPQQQQPIIITIPVPTPASSQAPSQPPSR